MLDSAAFLITVFCVVLSVLLLRVVLEDYIQACTQRAARRETQRARERGIWVPLEQVESLQIGFRQHGRARRQQEDSGESWDQHAVAAAARR